MDDTSAIYSALDNLATLPDEEKKARIAKLDPEAMGVLTKHVLGWQAQRKARPTAPSAGLMTSADTGQPAPGQPSPTVLPPPGDPTPAPTDTPNPMFQPHEGAQAIKSGVQDVLRPMADSAAVGFSKLVNPEQRAASELEVRRAMSNLGGEQVMRDMPAERLQEGVRELEEAHPILGAQNVLAAADFAGGSIPFMFMPTFGLSAKIEAKAAGWLAKGALTPETAPVLTTLVRAGYKAVEGASVGSIYGAANEYATPGGDVVEGAKSGAKFGAVVGAAHGVIGGAAEAIGAKLGKKVPLGPSVEKPTDPTAGAKVPEGTTLGVLTPEGQAQLGDELTQVRAAGGAKLADLASQAKAAKSPMTLVARGRYVEGKPVVEVSHLAYDKGGHLVVRAQDLPVDTEAQAQAFNRLKDNANVNFTADANFLRQAIEDGKSNAWHENILGIDDRFQSDAARPAPTGEPTVSDRAPAQDLPKITAAPAQKLKLTTGPNGHVQSEPISTSDWDPMEAHERPPPPVPEALGEGQQPDPDALMAMARGASKPPPPPPPGSPPGAAGPPALPPNVPKVSMQDMKALDAMRQAPGFLQRIWDGYAKAVMGRGFNSPIEQQRINAQQVIAAREMRANSTTYQKAIENYAPNISKPGVEADMVKVFSNAMDWPEFEAKHGAASGELKQLFQDMHSQNVSRHQELAEAGMIPPEYANIQKYADEKGSATYMPMLYLRRLAPGKYLKQIPDQLKLDAINAISDAWKKTPAEAHDILQTMLGADDPAAALRATGDKAFNHLKGTTDLPAAVRSVLGPTGSIMRISEGLAIQDQLVLMKRAFESISQDPTSFSTMPKQGWVQIPNDKTVYGPLAGGYWPRVLDEAMNNVRQLPGEMSKWQNFMSGLAKFRKANMIMGPGTLLKHIVGLMDAQSLSGGLYETSPMAAAKYMKDAMTQLRSYKENPTEANTVAARVWDAKRTRGLEQSWTAVETKDPAVRRALDRFYTENISASHPLDIFSKARDILYKGKDMPIAATRAVYDTLNDTVRLANYNALIDKFEARGMSASDARGLSGERIAMSFPSGTNVGKMTEAIRSNPARGLVLSFATPAIEKLRAYSLVPMRLAQEPDLAARLAVHEMWKIGLFGLAAAGATTVAGDPLKNGFAGAMRRMNGISDAEADAVKANMSKSSYEFHPGAISSPIRDERGEPVYYDISPGSFLLEAMGGNPEDHWTKRFSNGLVGEVAGGGVKEGAQVLEQHFGLLRGDLASGGRPIPGEEMRTLGHAALNSGMIPQFAATAISGQMSQHPSSPFQRPNTPGRAIAKDLGVPIVPPAQPAQAGKQDLGEMKELIHRQVRQVLMDQRMSVEEKKLVVGRILETAQMPQGPIDRMQNRSQATQKAGPLPYLNRR